MLPKQYRLPSPEISRVLRSGKRIHGSGMTFVVASNNVMIPRFAFIVSASVDKLATARNRIKRALRESIRATLLKQPTTGKDIVCIARKEIGVMKKEHIDATVKKSLMKL